MWSDEEGMRDAYDGLKCAIMSRIIIFRIKLLKLIKD